MKLSPLALVILSIYFVMLMSSSIFAAIPGLHIVLAFAITPLAGYVTYKELFYVTLVYYYTFVALNSSAFLLPYLSVLKLINPANTLAVGVFSIAYIGTIIGGYILMAATNALTEKLAFRFLPKRLKLAGRAVLHD